MIRFFIRILLPTCLLQFDSLQYVVCEWRYTALVIYKFSGYYLCCSNRIVYAPFDSDIYWSEQPIQTRPQAQAHIHTTHTHIPTPNTLLYLSHIPITHTTHTPLATHAPHRGDEFQEQASPQPLPGQARQGGRRGARGRRNRSIVSTASRRTCC